VIADEEGRALSIVPFYGGFAKAPEEVGRLRRLHRISLQAVDALDVFATLSHLFVISEANIPEFLNYRAVWFAVKSVLYPHLSQVHLVTHRADQGLSARHGRIGTDCEKM